MRVFFDIKFVPDSEIITISYSFFPNYNLPYNILALFSFFFHIIVFTPIKEYNFFFCRYRLSFIWPVLLRDINTLLDKVIVAIYNPLDRSNDFGVKVKRKQ